MDIVFDAVAQNERALCLDSNQITARLFQDPLMRRIEGAPIIPAGALLRNEAPVIRRRNRIIEWVHNFQFRAKKIDVISRVMFPGIFTLFNIMYWSYYLTQDQQSSNKK